MIPILSRILNACVPLLLLCTITAVGFLPALRRQLLNPSLKNWLSPRRWWGLIFEAGFPFILEQADCQWAPQKKQIMSNATGTILEVGPGAGHTINYYAPENVKRIIGIEPYLPLHPLTRKAIERAELTSKYELIGASIEDSEILANHGVLPGTVDSIVCVQVLCSIPNPERVIAEMYKLLKPGGQLVLFEHVRSQDPITQFLQDVWTYCSWHALTGCNFNRPTETWLRNLGEWSSVELQAGPGETNVTLVPHAFGRLVKAK